MVLHRDVELVAELNIFFPEFIASDLISNQSIFVDGAKCQSIKVIIKSRLPTSFIPRTSPFDLIFSSIYIRTTQYGKDEDDR